MVLAEKRQITERNWQEQQPESSRPQPARRWRVRLHPMLLLSLVALVTVWLVATGIGQRVRAIELEYEIQEMNERLNQLQKEEQQLQLEIARLQSLARVERLARSRLGMVEPGSSRVVVLKDLAVPDRSLGQPDAGVRVAVTQGKRLWAAVFRWMGALLPAFDAAEAGHSGR